MNVGPRVHQLRKSAGWTLQELADRVDSSKSYIWEIENKEKDISLSLALKFADAFCKTIQVFLYASDQASKELILAQDLVREIRHKNILGDTDV